MKQVAYHLLFASSMALGCLVTPSSVGAQIVPDNTLPENSLVAPGCTVCTIDGGTVRGTNLFHSFSEFSVPNEGEAFFNNGVQIQNILTRVTGNTVSNIDGLISANGTANLFLLNPNGIIFSGGATLDIGGSFVASTARSVVFEDGTIFSAAPATPTAPLLTISLPLGLQYGTNPGSVRVQGATLDVGVGQTLALMGGEVSLNDGFLYTPFEPPGGRVELGGLAGEGTIGLSHNGSYLSLSFPDGVARGDVSMTNGAVVDVIAGGGGSIGVNARNLTMTGEDTRLLAGMASDRGSVDAKAGDIEIKATEAINLNGSIIANFVQRNAVGNGGDINITTRELFVINGAQVNTFTRGQGKAGSMNIVAGDTVFFDGEGSDRRSSGAFSSVEETGMGYGGDINITTRELYLTNGAYLSASTNGQGNAGSVNINATDTVSFSGEDSARFASGVFSQVNSKGVGHGGDINITTGSLFVTNSAQVSASTNGQGNAGSVNINATNSVSFDDGSAFSSVAKGSIGNGGGINITTGLLSLTNDAALVIRTSGEGDAGNINVKAEQLFLSSNAALIGDVDPNAKGRGGDITLTTEQLSVLNGARVTVSSTGLGNAGNLEVTANSVLLDNGQLNAEIASGAGGNIALQVEDSLRVRNNSLISARALGDANGGNITIDAGVIVALPPDGTNGSDIIASGDRGNGGRINIEAQGIFRLAERRAILGNGTNDIDASSEFGAAGEVNINTVIDPSRGLSELPANLVDATTQLDRSCAVRSSGQENRFVITGMGGLPPRPGDPIDSPFPTGEVRVLPGGQRGQGSRFSEMLPQISPFAPLSPSPTAATPVVLVEASGWVRRANGEVILVAQAPNIIPHSPGSTSPTCH